MSHPFRGAAVPDPYADEHRTRRRSNALLSAKTSGRNISQVVLGHTDTADLPPAPMIADLGCARAARPTRPDRGTDDIAAAIAFLASDDAAWITGVVLPVDGGILAIPARSRQ